ncbi:MAG: bifunctional diaminohydroxyphosphoribosylaminopyrimidine deaminase/5-amino-6-(5-phosphoribosylamino)uracil reductase RibD [Deltaproteobacteria bacterium]|nr:bifunctional diaminohydroxyphosphoribosylaminopyrimidine deaminase/5-amino-6-(5-phosphoribosylamino)uracil reductase RibD [Deltaproteobacteria bacterium]
MSESIGDFDRACMKQAILLAEKGIGRTAPNPPVGAVVARNGRIVGKGFHRGAGMPHAEIEALKHAGDKAGGSTIYVTLEPCDHYGRTPPCTLALIKAGIKRVVAGTLDPNPRVRGKGVSRLQDAGVDVSLGVMEMECKNLIRPYAYWMKSKRPLVTVKAAVTLDGYLAARTGDSKWVTNEKSRSLVMKMRDRCDAVMVGARTVNKDDPLLSARIRRGRDPVRIILDAGLSVPLSSRVFDTKTGGRTIVYASRTASRAKAENLGKKGIEVVRVRAGKGLLDLPMVLDDLGKRGFHHLLVEGGGTVLGEFFRHRLVDRAAVFVAPKILTGSKGVKLAAMGPGPAKMSSAILLKDPVVRKLGTDVLFEGDVIYPLTNDWRAA